MSAVIETVHLTKRYRDLVAVNDLNLKVDEGEVFGFLGPNGSGKTTTILMLLGRPSPPAVRRSSVDSVPRDNPSR
jgi:ABC-2 type transport system ATP-binding protein